MRAPVLFVLALVPGCKLGCEFENKLVQTADASPDAPVDAVAMPDAARADNLCRDDAGTWHLPNPAWTPGKVCAPSDPTFHEWRYGGRVAVCVRYVTTSEKDRIAARYGLPKDAYKTVEFDHYIPLSAGGSDDEQNIWPQPKGEALEKDVLEMEIYNALAAGVIDQDEAITRIRAWRPASCP